MGPPSWKRARQGSLQSWPGALICLKPGPGNTMSTADALCGASPMKAMVLRSIGQALVAETRPDPLPGPGEIRVRGEACAVCRTDLHVVDGDLTHPRLPLIPG